MKAQTAHQKKVEALQLAGEILTGIYEFEIVKQIDKRLDELNAETANEIHKLIEREKGGDRP